jgi:hypothetical protein
MGDSVTHCGVFDDCAIKELAWADLRRPPADSQHHVGLEGFHLRAGTADRDPLQFILSNAEQIGFAEVFQVRISHRPEAPSRLRLAKGLFPSYSSRSAVCTEELLLQDGRVVLVGIWQLVQEDFVHSSEGCRDQATCCFVFATKNLPHQDLISAIKRCVVVNGICAINYPDIAASMHTMGHVVAKFHPGNREDVVLLAGGGAARVIGSWLKGTAGW